MTTDSEFFDKEVMAKLVEIGSQGPFAAGLAAGLASVAHALIQATIRGDISSDAAQAVIEEAKTFYLTQVERYERDLKMKQN